MAERHATKGDDGRFRREAVEERFPGQTVICHNCGGRVIWRRNNRDDWNKRQRCRHCALTAYRIAATGYPRCPSLGAEDG